PEFEVATFSMGPAQKNAGNPDDRLAHVGFFLTGKGVNILERAAEMRILLRSILPRIARKFPLAFYLGGIFIVTLAVTIPLLQHAATMEISNWMLALITLLA